MSDGMSDARAEGELYRAVWRSVYDIRRILIGEAMRGQFPYEIVTLINELLVDLGWRFQPSRRYEPSLYEVGSGSPEKLWDAVASLRLALRGVMVGHRGWSPTIDPEVDYALTGTGYELVQFEKVWLGSDYE